MHENSLQYIFFSVWSSDKNQYIYIFLYITSSMVVCFLVLFTEPDCELTIRRVSRSSTGATSSVATTLEALKPWTCSLCGNAYKSGFNLRVHMRNIHGPDSRPVTCPICSSVYKNSHSLQCHISTVHNRRAKPL
jgi:uncharacterized Zn-finger protein